MFQLKSLKTILFSLLIGFSFFLFPNLINATEKLTFEIVEPYVISEENKNMLNEFLDLFEQKYSDYNYVLSQTDALDNGYMNLYYWEKSISNNINGIVLKNASNSTYSRAMLSLNNVASNVAYKQIGIFTSDNYINNRRHITNLLTTIKNDEDLPYSNYSSLVDNPLGRYLPFNDTSASKFALARSNIDNLNVYQGTSGFNASTYDIELIYYEKTLNIGDKIPFLLDTKPTITFGKNDIGKNTFINVEFSIFDTNKYIYEYSLYDTSNWTEISRNYFLKQVYQNGTMFVRILDRNTQEYVTSATFTFNNVFPGSENIENNNGTYEHENKTYSNYIRIPVSDIYDQEKNVWKRQQYIFVADSKNNTKPKIDFYIYEKDKEDVSQSNPIPLLVYLNKNIMDLKEYMEKVANSPNSNPDGYGGGFSLGGGSFGGGGGGGRFDDDEDTNSCTILPLTYEVEMDSFTHYLSLSLNFSTCQDLSTKTPADFTTEYIYIFYNGKLYKDEFEAIEDLFGPSDSNNIFDFFNSNKNMSSEIGSMLDNVWSYFKENKITSYILLLISGSLIIVLINGFNR